MTLNTNYAGAVQMAPRSRLEGLERGLDALVGLVILLAELAIGLLSIYALYDLGLAAGGAASVAADIGFGIAVFGSGIAVLVTTIVYLARVVVGRRSWPAPLWGTILMTVALVVGYFVIAS